MSNMESEHGLHPQTKVREEYQTPLHLTSPLMRGQNVKDAQYLLAGHNRFKNLAPYKDGKLDAQYGPLTAQATKRAKYWLGYAHLAVNGQFGQTLYEFLRPKHWRPLPDDFRTRRTERLAAAAVTTGQKLLSVAETQLGYRETPNNRTKYGEWYGFNGVAWCAIFESWCAAQIGKHDFKYSYVGAIASDAYQGRNGLYVVRTPRRGDIACLTLHGDRWAHTSIVVDPPVGGTWHDLGGNTGPTSISNGGMVARGVRYTSQVAAWIRMV